MTAKHAAVAHATLIIDTGFDNHTVYAPLGVDATTKVGIVENANAIAPPS